MGMLYSMEIKFYMMHVFAGIDRIQGNLSYYSK